MVFTVLTTFHSPVKFGGVAGASGDVSLVALGSTGPVAGRETGAGAEARPGAGAEAGAGSEVRAPHRELGEARDEVPRGARGCNEAARAREAFCEGCERPAGSTDDR